MCTRRGCQFHHRHGQWRNGFCCNACRYDEAYHTNNCTGRGQLVIRQYLFMCKRRGCPFQRKDGHFTWHLFCCNACKRGGDAEQVPEIYHTEDCTGEESSTMALASEQSSMMAFQYGVVPLRRPSLYTNFPMAKTSFRIPPSWACTDNNIVDFIGYWYFWGHNFCFSQLSQKRHFLVMFPTKC